MLSEALDESAKDVRRSRRVWFALLFPCWLRPSALPLTIVCGPPASGKTSYVAAHAGPDDVVIDLDRLAANGADEAPRDRMTLARLLRERNQMLGELHTLAPDGRRAWFIVGAPGARERERWARQLVPVQVVVLKPPSAVCLQRIEEDAERAGARDRLRGAVDSWFRRYGARTGERVLEGTD